MFEVLDAAKLQGRKPGDPGHTGDVGQVGHVAQVVHVDARTDTGNGATEPHAKPTSFAPKGVYASQHHHASGALGKENGVVAQSRFGLAAPSEFGELPLELRTKLALDVSLKRRRKVEADESARLVGWREDYGKHLTESTLVFAADGKVTFGDRELVPLEGAKGRTTLGIYVLQHEDGPRIVKLLPQTGFHDALAGNLLAEKIGGAKIHSFGRLEVEGGTGRLENYRAVMFLEMEQLHPGDAHGRLKEILKEIKEGAPPRLTLEQLGAGFAKTVVAAMVAGVSPNDPDVLFDKKANARVIDGDFYQQQFDPEETVAMLRLAFREHGWDDFKPVFKDALVKAIAEAAVPDHKRRNLRDAVDVF